jgi:hypothetical protein
MGLHVVVPFVEAGHVHRTSPTAKSAASPAFIPEGAPAMD